MSCFYRAAAPRRGARGLRAPLRVAAKRGLPEYAAARYSCADCFFREESCSWLVYPAIVEFSCPAPVSFRRSHRMAPEEFRLLLRAFAPGDAEAAARLVREYEPSIRRFVHIRLADAHLRRRSSNSMDVCQSVLANFFVPAGCRRAVQRAEPSSSCSACWSRCKRATFWLNHARDQQARPAAMFAARSAATHSNGPSPPATPRSRPHRRRQGAAATSRAASRPRRAASCCRARFARLGMVKVRDRGRAWR